MQSPVYALRAWSNSSEDSPGVRTSRRTEQSARMPQVLSDGQGRGLSPTKQRSGRRWGVACSSPWCHKRVELQRFLRDWGKCFYRKDPRNRRPTRPWMQDSDFSLREAEWTSWFSWGSSGRRTACWHCQAVQSNSGCPVGLSMKEKSSALLSFPVTGFCGCVLKLGCWMKMFTQLIGWIDFKEKKLCFCNSVSYTAYNSHGPPGQSRGDVSLLQPLAQWPPIISLTRSSSCLKVPGQLTMYGWCPAESACALQVYIWG